MVSLQPTEQHSLRGAVPELVALGIVLRHALRVAMVHPRVINTDEPAILALARLLPHGFSLAIHHRNVSICISSGHCALVDVKPQDLSKLLELCHQSWVLEREVIKGAVVAAREQEIPVSHHALHPIRKLVLVLHRPIVVQRDYQPALVARIAALLVDEQPVRLVAHVELEVLGRHGSGARAKAQAMPGGRGGGRGRGRSGGRGAAGYGRSRGHHGGGRARTRGRTRGFLLFLDFLHGAPVSSFPRLQLLL
mmetsp:Transcript_17212/g.19232  ORF Transcript_17212/g.19232 Transcript_17212/m.19232 type:complete len:251 (-) Transcript_17212:5-757(-)